MKIKKLEALEIIDSRGFPTIRVYFHTEDGRSSFANVPSGASTGSHEAYELRDNDLKRYLGKGVLGAVKNVEETISTAVSGIDFKDQRSFDNFLINLDGTDNKSSLGANAILGCSLAFSLALANDGSYTEYIRNLSNSKEDLKLPVPLMNILNGGKHADNKISIQEFMIVPVSGDKFSEALCIGGNVFHTLKSILKSKGYNTNVGDEGGFAPNLRNTEEALDFLSEAIVKSGYKAGEDVLIALDCAASEFYDLKTKKYKLDYDSDESSLDRMVSFYKKLIKNYPIFSIEDPMSEHDHLGFEMLYKEIGDSVQIVGDDLFVTNVKLLNKFKDPQLANSVLIKPNQIGTLTEMMAAIDLAKKIGYQPIMSHRSGETEDNIIANLAVGSGCKQVKFGSLCRSDRVSKYNKLLEIEKFGVTSEFFGPDILNYYKRLSGLS